MFKFISKFFKTEKPTPVRLSAIFIQPGVGSFVTNKQSVYFIDMNENAMENGSMIPNGEHTCQMAYYNDLVYAQDSVSKYWYNWNGKHWSSIVTEPPRT